MILFIFGRCSVTIIVPLNVNILETVEIDKSTQGAKGRNDNQS